MSKGHVDALRAMREANAARHVTKPPKAIVTVTKALGGRPKVHASAADRQRACRSRKAQSHAKA